jgi:apolipoprotein N-acyltransferase
MEFARMHLPEIAFPWNLAGYPASENVALMQLAPLTGIFGLSLVVCAFNALCAWACAAASVSVVRRFTTVAAVVALLILIAIAGPGMVPQQRPGHTARLVQLDFPEVPSYPPNWMDLHGGEMDELERMSLAPPQRSDVRAPGGPDFMVWPEAPAPFMFLDPKFATRAERLAKRAGHPFLVGVIEWKTVTDSDGSAKLQPYNSAVMLDARGQRIFAYDKIHLVPFGEYEPFPLIHHVVTSVSTEVGGFRKGSLYAVGQFPAGERFGVFICYEAIFPNEVRRFVAGGANLLINISNDGWFGRSAAPDQHLLMARVRAAENRRWLLRATNNGFTVSIDPYGRIVGWVVPDVRDTLDAPYDFRSDRTAYTRFGDWVAWLSVLISGAFLFEGWQAKRQMKLPPEEA